MAADGRVDKRAEVELYLPGTWRATQGPVAIFIHEARSARRVYLLKRFDELAFQTEPRCVRFDRGTSS